jgi:hypothetical protein
MKSNKYRLGTGIVQLVPFTIQRQYVEPQPQAVQTKDNDFISWKLIKVCAIIAVIKVVVFFMLM